MTSAHGSRLMSDMGGQKSRLARRLVRAADVERAELRRHVVAGRRRRAAQGVYGPGPHPPIALAPFVRTGDAVGGVLAGVLHGLDNVVVQPVRPRPRPADRVVLIDGWLPWGDFVARVDLAWPMLGLFVELDGQHHADQPAYDARRETAVVAATGWLCGRFIWTEVVHLPRSTTRRLAELVGQAGRRVA